MMCSVGTSLENPSSKSSTFATRAMSLYSVLKRTQFGVILSKDYKSSSHWLCRAWIGYIIGYVHLIIICMSEFLLGGSLVLGRSINYGYLEYDSIHHCYGEVILLVKRYRVAISMTTTEMPCCLTSDITLPEPYNSPGGVAPTYYESICTIGQ